MPAGMVVAADLLAAAADEAEEGDGNREIICQQYLKFQPKAARELHTTTQIPLRNILRMAARSPEKVRRKRNQEKQNRNLLFQQRPLIATRKHQVLSCPNLNSQR